MNSSVIISFIIRKKIHTKFILFVYAYCGYTGICSFNYLTVTGLVSFNVFQLLNELELFMKLKDGDSNCEQLSTKLEKCVSQGK